MCRAGFTLFEVLLALMIITAGVLGLLGTLGPTTRLIAEGREQGRIALALESRLDWLGAEVRRNGCRPPESGSARGPDGVIEWWSTADRAGAVEIMVAARIAGRRAPPDSVGSRIPCP